MGRSASRLRLQGFNNLGKALSLNLHNVRHAATPVDQRRCIEAMESARDLDWLTRTLTDVTGLIGAEVLNVASRQYAPQGASVTLMIAEEPLANTAKPASEGLVAHLDKSHMALHTYPDAGPDGIVNLRTDVDIATCGVVSPLTALDYLLERFAADVVVADYRVRGFTRDVDGSKHFTDQPMGSIQDFLGPQLQARYRATDADCAPSHSFQTRLKLRQLDIDSCLFRGPDPAPDPGDSGRITALLERETEELFLGRNLG